MFSPILGVLEDLVKEKGKKRSPKQQKRGKEHEQGTKPLYINKRQTISPILCSYFKEAFQKTQIFSLFSHVSPKLIVPIKCCGCIVIEPEYEL